MTKLKLINLSERFIAMANAYYQDNNKTFDNLFTDFHSPFPIDEVNGFPNIKKYDGTSIFADTVSAINILFDLCQASTNTDIVNICDEYINIIIGSYPGMADGPEKQLIPDLKSALEAIYEKFKSDNTLTSVSQYTDYAEILNNINRVLVMDCLQEMDSTVMLINNYTLNQINGHKDGLADSSIESITDAEKAHLEEKHDFINNVLFNVSHNLVVSATCLIKF